MHAQGPMHGHMGSTYAYASLLAPAACGPCLLRRRALLTIHTHARGSLHAFQGTGITTASACACAQQHVHLVN